MIERQRTSEIVTVEERIRHETKSEGGGGGSYKGVLGIGWEWCEYVGAERRCLATTPGSS